MPDKKPGKKAEKPSKEKKAKLKDLPAKKAGDVKGGTRASW